MTMKGANIKTVCEVHASNIEDIIDTLEDDVEQLYLTDKEWDDFFTNVIDPLNRALTHLQALRDDADGGYFDQEV